MAHLEFSFKDEKIHTIICSAFSGAKTRRSVKVDFRETYQVHDFWDGGSRDECRFVRLSDMSVLSSESIPMESRQVASNPFNLPIAEVKLNPGFVIVVHMIMQGKNLGYRIIAHKDSHQLLTAPNIKLLAAQVDKKRYIISGSAQKGWSVVDTETAGMPSVEHGIALKWLATQRCDDYNKDHEKNNKTK